MAERLRAPRWTVSREALTWMWLGFSGVEAAKLMNVTESNFYSAVSRAKTKYAADSAHDAMSAALKDKWIPYFRDWEN